MKTVLFYVHQLVSQVLTSNCTGWYQNDNAIYCTFQFSMIDTSAATNIGRALAKRCVDSGITNCIPNVTSDEIERSKRVSNKIFKC